MRPLTARPLVALLAAAALGSLFPGRLAAQLPAAPAPPFAGEIDVAEALVDVLVTDRDGNVILGLAPGDFRITEAGRPLEVTGATFYSNRRFLDSAGAAKLGLDPAAVPDRRLYVLLIDDQSRLDSDDPTLLLGRQMKAGREIARWLRGGLEPGDAVALLSYDGRLRLQQEFTADRSALERALDRAVRSADEPKEWPSRAAAPNELPSLAATLPKGDALREASKSLEAALATLADALAPIAGRKNLILTSSGFGRLTGAGAPEATKLTPTIEALNAANVAVYAADLLPPGTTHPWSAVVSELSYATGGRPFFDLTDFSVPFERVAATTNGYYLVSFRSPHPAGESGYKAIEVTVANPEFRVTGRRGYRIGGAAPTNY
jgi:VWFA-related protein